MKDEVLRNGIDLMNAQVGKVEDLEQYESMEYVAEQKFDGGRIQIVKKDYIVKIMGRGFGKSGVRGDYTNRITEITEDIERVVEDVILDAEVITRDQDFLKVQTRIRTIEQDEELKEKIPVVAKVFDILYYDGEWVVNKTFRERRKILETFFEKYCFKAVELVEQRKDLRKFYDEMVEEGREGIMVKDPNAIYEIGGRKKAWLKIIPIFEDDFVAIGKKEGTGRRRNANWFGALICETKDKSRTFRVGGGFSDEELSRIGDMDFPFVIKVQYKEISKYGVPRNPVFLRLRDDKEVEEVRSKQTSLFDSY